MAAKTRKVTGHHFFDSVRAHEKTAQANNSAPFYQRVEQWLVSFDLAVAELGVPEGVLLDLAYRRKIFFVFHRPVGVEVRKVAQYVQHYEEAAGSVEQPTFLVLPSGASFDLHFQDQVDLWDVEMAMSFSPVRGLAGRDLSPLRPSTSEPLNANWAFSLNAREDDWKAAWGCWGFLRNGKRSAVRVSKKDLFLPVEELDLARSLQSQVRGGSATTSRHSKKLQLLIEASYKFWIETGAASDKTVPRPLKQDVVTWLLQRGIGSRSLADAADTLIRPEAASMGGRPRKPDAASEDKRE